MGAGGWSESHLRLGLGLKRLSEQEDLSSLLNVCLIHQSEVTH